MFPSYADIKMWYDNGYWTADMVQEAAALHYITDEEMADILKGGEQS